MILVINGTNRPNSNSKIVSEYCLSYLKSQGVAADFLNMEDIEPSFFGNHMYNSDQHTPQQIKIQDEQLIPSKNWLIISPEYNGSFAGVLKMFFDGVSTRKYAETFAGHNAGLIGVASGRAGNLRGMEHLTGFLNYLKLNVFYNKLPLSSISTLVLDGQMTDAAKETVNTFLDAFVTWTDGK